MVRIYQDYDDEPEDIFLPLPEELASEFYALEMDRFTADTDFFESLLPRQGTFLELGCGTGRIAAKLAGSPGLDRMVIGIDNSIPMLRLAARRHQGADGSLAYYCMDMMQLAFSVRFDAILIAYNTLNLLDSKDHIIECLIGCRNRLQRGGKLLVQLFIPTEDFIHRQKTFQFQMFDRPGGGKIIKEILKHYEPLSQKVHIEERFRIRPMQKGIANEDWHTTYTIAGFSGEQWLTFFHQSGFTQLDLYGDYAGNSFNRATSSILLGIFTLQ